MSAIIDGFVDINITITDFQVKTAIRISANPGFVLNRCALTAKIRKRDQITSFAFLALGEIVGRFQRSHLPACIV
jgi:hypothetical protein